MPVVVTNNSGADYRLPDRRLIPDGESVVLSDKELEWIPLDRRSASDLEVTALPVEVEIPPVNVGIAYFATRVDEASSTVTYVGKAEPGSSPASAVWQIKRITESGASTVIEYAGGSDLFDQVWVDRASLTYS